MNQIIELSEAAFIGAGRHKKTFIDPTDSGRCIKIVYTNPDIDMERELKYRAIREKRNLKSSMLPMYYGTVRTNMGIGYVFERVIDYDGKTSKALYYLLEDAALDLKKLPFVVEVLQKFKSLWFEELIVTSNTQLDNFLFQRISDTKFTIRIIDNIGSPVFIPLSYYFESFAKRRSKKYWKRLLNELQQKYPSFMSEELKEKLQ